MGKKAQENYKCTKARVNMILCLISEGLFRKDACLLSGILRETFHQWLREGKKYAEEGKESLERELYEGLRAGTQDRERQESERVRMTMRFFREYPFIPFL
ncbi:MAG: hypothetical protein MI685_08505 [Chlorobiales bacterium]|nr:hypothetical protein [Chlorobiales bacterium]